LLPARGGDLEEEIEVTGPDGEVLWFACLDEWYGDFTHSEIGQFLENGMRWTSDGATWVLSSRDVYVLAPNPTIFGYVSATRLMLNEDHLVLCRESVEEAVRKELEQACCGDLNTTRGRGVPDGWVLFGNVHPTVSVEHEEAVGILNTLRPIDELEIYFKGGIRLTHNKWLYGHPPQIRIRGGSRDMPTVSIDGDSASVDDEGNYITPKAAAPGPHIVFSGGKTAPYEIANGRETWDPFVAYEYVIDRSHNMEVAVCGPLVMGHGDQALVPRTNRCLVGAEPGQVFVCELPYGQSTDELLAVTGFPVVWALPDNPYRCNKKQVFVTLVTEIAVGSVEKYLRSRPSYELLFWCDAILNSSRRGLRVDPANDDLTDQWFSYVRAARQIRRSMR
jgi:hypothetical protein